LYGVRVNAPPRRPTIRAWYAVGQDASVSTPREVVIREEQIRLGQFLKLADLVDAGSDAKPLLAQGRVAVNGETETRRGRRLERGDVVTVGDASVRVG